MIGQISTPNAVGKRLRFEIFKRDSFRCQYCGSSPPKVVLHVDHIHPASAGGSNEESNLITSCLDCNIGKGPKLLGDCRSPLKVSVASEELERLEQLKSYQEHLRQRRQVEEEGFLLVSESWVSRFGDNPEEFQVSGELEQAVRRFLKKLSIAEVLESMDSAFSNVRHSGRERDVFKYFCGACWRKIKRASGEETDVR